MLDGNNIEMLDVPMSCEVYQFGLHIEDLGRNYKSLQRKPTTSLYIRILWRFLHDDIRTQGNIETGTN